MDDGEASAGYNELEIDNNPDIHSDIPLIILGIYSVSFPPVNSGQSGGDGTKIVINSRFNSPFFPVRLKLISITAADKFACGSGSGYAQTCREITLKTYAKLVKKRKRDCDSSGSAE